MNSKQFCDWLRGILDGASLVSADRHMEMLAIIDKKLKEVSDSPSHCPVSPLDKMTPCNPYTIPVSPSIPPIYPWTIPTGPTCNAPYSSIEEFYKAFSTYTSQASDL